jgi:hypothetical protein
MPPFAPRYRRSVAALRLPDRGSSPAVSSHALGEEPDVLDEVHEDQRVRKARSKPADHKVLSYIE